MNTRHEKVFRLLGHEIRFTVTDGKVVRLTDDANLAIDDGNIEKAEKLINESIEHKGFESTDDTIALARIERRVIKDCSSD